MPGPVFGSPFLKPLGTMRLMIVSRADNLEPMMSEILKAAEKFRIQLLSMDDDALKGLERSYLRTVERLQERIDALAYQIEEAIAKGEILEIDHPSWLGRQQRYHALMDQIDDEMTRYGIRATNVIASQQEEALKLGISHSQDLMKVSLGPVPAELVKIGVSVAWDSVNFSALENMIGFLSDGSPLSYKFAGMSEMVKADVKDAISSSLAMGQGPRQMASAVNNAAQGQMSNVLTTCRTETMRAYRTASSENYRANSDILDGWIWICAHQPTTCAACWGMDGSFHPLEEDLNDHVNGRCSQLPKTKSWQDLLPDQNLEGIPDTSAQPWDPEKYFSKLTPDQQRFVLGRSKFEMWQAGEIKLSDIPTTRTDPGFGESVAISRVSDLKELADSRALS